MMLKVQIALFLTVALLAGCGQVIVFGHTVREGNAASEVKTDPAIAPGATVDIRVQKVSEVTLLLTPQAAEQVATDSRFNASALLDAIKSELQSHQLLDVTSAQGSGTMNISIDDYALRSTTNAILFGNSINAGTLSGNLVLHDEHGNELPGRRIEVQARVSIPESGGTENPLRPLYREFAVAVFNSLTGTSTKSNAAPDQPPR